MIFGQIGRRTALLGSVVVDETRLSVAALDASIDAVQAEVERFARFRVFVAGVHADGPAGRALEAAGRF